LVTVVGLKWAFALASPDTTPLGYALRYVRYASAGLVGVAVAPWLFLRLGLAEGERSSGQPAATSPGTTVGAPGG
jgi:hypothetical protein